MLNLRRNLDAVLMLDVLEHMTKVEGIELIKKATVWARKLVVISTPNDYVPQDEQNGNLLQQHKAGWTWRT